MPYQNPQLLRNLIHGFANVHILCIGDIMLDKFVYGKVDRISPEAPVPVFHVHREIQSLGGAGNVVQNLASLGARVSFASVIGNDGCGAEIKKQLKALPTVHAHLSKESLRVSTQKTRYIAATQQLIRADQEQSTAIEQSTINDLKTFIEQEIQKVQLVILSDYGKGVLQPDFITWIIATAKHYHKRVIVDPKGTDYSIYRGCDLITPNAKELSQASGQSTTTNEQAVNAAQYIRQSCGIHAVLATRGEKGMSLVLDEEQVIHIPTRALEVFDVSGAGDTVISVVGACMAQGAELNAAAILANMAAGLVVAKIGTASLSPQEILGTIENIPHSSVQGKLITATQGTQKIVEWHRKGLKVGFTNGCFDLLHPGHIFLIQQARKSCDRLIIGLNSDESVKRLKGPTRPVQSQEARAAVLSALADVDRVIIFDEDTPLELIMLLRPDVLIKGSDYTVSQIAGAKEVLSWGGEVVLADLKHGFSTTSTIQKLTAPTELAV
jgi:D-beta-D-heptose 7-phosphate kinase/D-beta-D-heptose 1-phosphate adenosyltransferase